MGGSRRRRRRSAPARPDRPGSSGTLGRSPSITSIRSSSSAGIPPAAATASAKIGLRSRPATRSSALAEPLRRTSTDGRVSGSSVRIFHSSCSPMNPVTPVITSFSPPAGRAAAPAVRGRRRGRCLLTAAPEGGVGRCRGDAWVLSVDGVAAARRASSRVKLPTYSAVPMIAPSSPSGTIGQREHVGQGAHPAAGDDRSVGRGADPAQQIGIRAPRTSMPSRVGVVTKKQASPARSSRSRVSIRSPPSRVQPRAAGRLPRSSRLTAIRSPS